MQVQRREAKWGKWVAEIREPNRGARLWLGTFNASHEAAMAYDTAARKLFGPTAKLNLPYAFSPPFTTTTAVAAAATSAVADDSVKTTTTTSKWVCGIQELKHDHEEYKYSWGCSNMFDEIRTENWVEFPIDDDTFGINNIEIGVEGEEIMDWVDVEVSRSL